LLTIILDVQTIPVISNATANGSVIGEEGLVYKITSSIPSKPPVPIACILILKYVFANKATDEERKTLKTNEVNIDGISL
jgi:hypothetical protein